MQRSQIEHCAVPVWYPHFRPVTFDTLFIPLTPDFLAYLLADGIVLPSSLLPKRVTNPDPDDSDASSEGDDEEWSETKSAPQPDFPDLEAKIKHAIDRLGGEVFAKLNWSSPRDASWILHDNTLCCRAPLDVILLLKSSDFIIHDLTQAFKECLDGTSEIPQGGFTLALRRYTNILPAGEFRCFIKNNQLVGVSQRHVRQFFSSLVNDKINILNDIQQFFYSYIQHKYPDPDFVFDVYRVSVHHVVLVDFNPFCRVTDPLLFTWDELQTVSEGGAVLRVVEDPGNIKGHPHAANRIPQDIVSVNNESEINNFVSMFNNGAFNEDSDDDL